MILFLTYHRVTATPAAGEPTDVYTVTAKTFEAHLEALQAAGLPPQPPETLLSARPHQARCCYLSFDDATADHFEVVAPQLQAHGWRAVFFVPTEKLDRPGRLTRAQLRELAAAGHTIGCHGHEHRRMDTLSAPELQQQLDVALRILREETGSAPWIFAPPGGYLNATVRDAASERGLRVIRTMRWGLNHRPDLTALETVPIHCDTDRQALERMLAGKRSAGVYAAKEALKALLPIGVYERLRALVFGLKQRL